MKSRSLAALAAVLSLFSAGTPAAAAPTLTCRDVFQWRMNGLSLSEAEFSSQNLEVAFTRLEADIRSGLAPDSYDLGSVLDIASRLLAGQRALIHKTEFEGFPALEIVPASSGSGWNRMAGSLLRNYGSRLLFAPVSLAREAANASFIPNQVSGENEHAVLISRASLLKGRAETSNLHEARHMARTLRRDQSPTILDGRILIKQDDSPESIAPGTEYYKKDMTFEELATFAQDLARESKTLLQDDSAPSRENLRFIAAKARDVAKNSLVAIGFLRALDSHLKDGVSEAGPILGDQGLEAGSAYLQLKDGTMIFIDRAGETSLRIQVEGERLILVYRLKLNDLNVTRLLSGLQTERPEAIASARQLLLSENVKWTADMKNAAQALGQKAQELFTEAQTASVARLAEHGRQARDAIAPWAR